jgi:transcriptional regulator with XRE-family HTH domain
MISERVRHVRHYHGWSQTDLAAKVGATQPHISKLERGASMSAALVDGIATVSGFARWWFDLGPLPDLPKGSLRFRKKSSSTQADEERVRAHIRQAIEVIERLRPRVLGVQLTEEIGKIFDDGHFLCSGQSMLVGMESLMTIEPLFMEQLYGWSQFVINRHMGRTDDERTRLSLASQWYQLANSTADPVLEFIYLWLVVEVMAMETADIRPAREQLMQILGGDDRLGQLVGRLNGTRSCILHEGPANARFVSLGGTQGHRQGSTRA